MLGVDYVISGHIRRLGGRKLVIATVICVETLELVAGYYRAYRYLWESRDFLPSMSAALVSAVLGRPSLGELPRLAVAHFGSAPDAAAREQDAPPRYGYDDADPHDMDTLAQILAIELANSGRYAVLPRASVMRAALVRWEARVAGAMDAALERLLELLLGDGDWAEAGDADGEFAGAITEIGREAEADMVLALEARAIGDVNMFAARILDTEDGSALAGVSRGYGAIADGVRLMAEIAILLTDHYHSPERIAALRRQRLIAGIFGDSARFWSVGVSVGSSFAAPWVIGTVHATLAPFPFSFLRIGGDLGFVSGADGIGYFSVYPFAHYVFFLPFSWGGLYAGAGGGFLAARHTFYGLVETRRGPLMDFTAGVSVWDRIDVSYTLRTNFSSANGKLSVGFTHRFRQGRM